MTMHETEKQEPTLNEPPQSVAAQLQSTATADPVPDQTPGPDANKPAVQDDTRVEVRDDTIVPMSAIMGHPTDGEHGRRMIFGFKGAGSHGVVIDHGAKRAPNTAGKVEAFGVRF